MQSVLYVNFYLLVIRGRFFNIKACLGDIRQTSKYLLPDEFSTTRRSSILATGNVGITSALYMYHLLFL